MTCKVLRNLKSDALTDQNRLPVIEGDQSIELEPFGRAAIQMKAIVPVEDHLGLHGILGRLLQSERRQTRGNPAGGMTSGHEHESANFPSAASGLDPLRFGREELVALACAAMLHPNVPGDSGVIRFADLRVDFAKMEVSRSSGELVVLTAKEFKVLRFFLLNPGRVVSRDELLNVVWGYECYPSTRTVDNHILRLRQKLEANPSHPVHFRTVHCVGYKFVP